MNSWDLSTDFSLAQWRMEKSLPAVGDIPNNYLLRLMDETGIAGYLKEPSCNMSDGVYAGAVNGWTNGKSAESDQQDEHHLYFHAIDEFILPCIKMFNGDYCK